MPKFNFIPPSQKKKLDAIGITQDPSTSVYTWKDKAKSNLGLPPVKYFIPTAAFLQIPKSKPGDWLSEHIESGQSVSRFTSGPRCHPIPRKNVIYIQPLEFYPDQNIDKGLIETLCSYASLFFDLQVRPLKSIIDFDGKGCLKTITRRLNDGEKQVNASEILSVLKLIKPKDAFCICGVTLCDIYPQDEWNFVFGYASTMDETGVYSLARYLPETSDRPMLLRAIRVMCHEICHMFGIKHCIYFSCLMNGSNHAEEAISRPTFLCPVCLRKLHYVCKFDIAQRYQKLLDFWESAPFSGDQIPALFEKDIEWLRERVAL